MRHNSFLKRIPGWLKWVLGVIGFLMAAWLIFGIYLYQAVQDNRTSSFQQIDKQVMQETKLKTVRQIERFHGDNAYYTVYGQTADDASVILFYPFDGNQSSIITVKESDIITKEKIKADWHNRCEACTLIDIKPAVVSDDSKQPAWELTYEDNTNRYVMEYLSIEDGAQMEIYRLNQLYD